MANTLAQAVQTALDIGGTTVTVSITVTAGNSLVILADWYHATSTLDSITITSESNGTILGSPQRNATISNKALQIAYLPLIANSGSKSVVGNWSAGGDMRLSVFEIAGGDTTTFSDGAPVGANGTGDPATLSLTTNTGNCSIFALCSSNGADPSPDTGYTNIVLSNEQWFDGGEYILDAGSAGAKTVQMTTSSAWTIAAAAFRTAGGAAPVDPSIFSSSASGFLGPTSGFGQMFRRARSGLFVPSYA